DARCPAGVRGLEPEVEHAAYRIAAEAVANVVKHAAARRLGVSFEEEGPQLTLAITDDGRGFDLEAVPSDRFGIQGMRERARAVGGTLHLASAPGAGAAVGLALEGGDDPRAGLWRSAGRRRRFAIDPEHGPPAGGRWYRPRRRRSGGSRGIGAPRRGPHGSEDARDERRPGNPRDPNAASGRACPRPDHLRRPRVGPRRR